MSYTDCWSCHVTQGTHRQWRENSSSFKRSSRDTEEESRCPTSGSFLWRKAILVRPQVCRLTALLCSLLQQEYGERESSCLVLQWNWPHPLKWGHLDKRDTFLSQLTCVLWPLGIQAQSVPRLENEWIFYLSPIAGSGYRKRKSSDSASVKSKTPSKYQWVVTANVLCCKPSSELSSTREKLRVKHTHPLLKMIVKVMILTASLYLFT